MSAMEFSAILKQRIAQNNKANKEKLDIIWKEASKNNDVPLDASLLEQLEIVKTNLMSLESIDIKSKISGFAIKDLSGIDDLVTISLSATDTRAQISKVLNAINKSDKALAKVKIKDLQVIRRGLSDLKESLKSADMEKLLKTTLNSMNTEEFLLNFKSSDSIIKKLEKQLMDTLLGNGLDPSISTTGNLPVDEISTDVKKELKKALEALKKAKEKVSKSNQRIRNKQGEFYSIFSLREILARRLAGVIRNNMGRGSAKRILNYRTGRFASTVYIQNLAVTKDGTVEAFYNYMKYPYATFAKGGRQQHPSTRDPNILIGKSIREIAREIIINKMRAIPV